MSFRSEGMGEIVHPISAICSRGGEDVESYQVMMREHGGVERERRTGGVSSHHVPACLRIMHLKARLFITSIIAIDVSETSAKTVCLTYGSTVDGRLYLVSFAARWLLTISI